MQRRYSNPGLSGIVTCYCITPPALQIGKYKNHKKGTLRALPALCNPWLMAVKEMKQKPGLQYRGKLMSPAYKQWTSPSPVKREQNSHNME